MAVSAARAAAFDILLRVTTQDAFAAELLHAKQFKGLSSIDHALAMQLVMGILRWQSKLDFAIAQQIGGGRLLAKLDVEVLIALRLGTYQIQYLERIPARAAVNESVELVKRARKRSAAPLVNAVLRNIAPAVEAAQSESVQELTPDRLAHHFSHPDWIVKRWLARFGFEQTRKICEYNQSVPALTIRMNNDHAAAGLILQRVECAPGKIVAGARRCVSGDLTKSDAYLQGGVTIQDEASQLVALLMGKDAAPGARILDCCAAPGGKTSLIAQRNPQARIVAVELYQHRARIMQNLVRAGNVSILAADVTHLPFHERFNRVLADVPCSGTGTLARNPEIKWKLRRSDLRELPSRQFSILQSAMNQVLTGGQLVYSTCSLEREENEDVVMRAMQSNPGFELLDCRSELKELQAQDELAWANPDSLCSGAFMRTIPGVHPCDGFFAAILQRINV